MEAGSRVGKSWWECVDYGGDNRDEEAGRFEGFWKEKQQGRKRRAQPQSEGGRRALGGSSGVRFWAAIRERNLKTSGLLVWPLSEMVITACPPNFVRCWDFAEELL